MLRRVMMAVNASGGGDPFWANVVALLHFDGTAGATSFPDEKGGSWAGAGGAQVSNSQSKFGGGSAAFNGAGGYAERSHNEAFNFGNGDFTVEAWVRPSSTPGTGSYGTIAAHDNIATSSNRGWLFLFDGDASGRVGFSCKVGTTSFNAYNTAALALNVWHHLAAVRDGSTLRLYVNGSQVASAAISGTLNSVTTPVRLGAAINGASMLGPGLNGYLDDLRITKGVCRYPSGTAFTPPSSAFPNS